MPTKEADKKPTRKRHVLQDRIKVLEEAAAFHEAERELRSLSEEEFSRLELLREARDQAWEDRQNATNLQEEAELTPPFLRAHKAYLSALGLKPCASLDCTKYVVGKRSHAKFCSEKCRVNEKSRRWRGRHPEEKMIADARYVNRFYPSPE